MVWFTKQEGGGYYVNRGNESDVMLDPRVNSRCKIRKMGSEGMYHIKPYEQARRLVRAHARPGATVFVPFSGSGTEMMAALNEGCNVVGIESCNGVLNGCINRMEHRGIRLHRRGTEAARNAHISAPEWDVSDERIAEDVWESDEGEEAGGV